MAFVGELKRLRESVNATYAQLDRALKPPKTNYLARVERGDLPLPDKETVLQLGEALREMGAETNGKALWALALPEVASRDPEVKAYYERLIEEERAKSGDFGVSPEEVFLILQVRALSGDLFGQAHPALWLGEAIEALRSDAAAMKIVRSDSPAAQSFLAFLLACELQRSSGIEERTATK